MTISQATARRVEYDDLDSLPAALRNPKGHKVNKIRASIDRFGFVTPSVVDERTGRLVVGHGRLEALREMREAGANPPEGVRLSEDGRWLVPVLYGWSSRSDAEAEAYLLADNQNTIAGGWENDGLIDMLRDIDQLDPTLLAVTGFADDQLAALLAGEHLEEIQGDDDRGDGTGDGGDDEAEESEAGKGDLLALAGTTIGEGDYPVEHLNVWHMGPRLTLVVANPHTEWAEFVPLLTGDALFMPYPSPMAALAEGAQDRDVVFVQPNKFLAGWLLTKWARVTGLTPTRDEP